MPLTATFSGTVPPATNSLAALDANFTAIENVIKYLKTAAYTGASASAQVDSTGNLTVFSSTGGIGYSTGSGGTVTQGTSKSTFVTLNKMAGQIVTHNASLAGGASVQFGVGNSLMQATDVIIVNVASAASTPLNYSARAYSNAAGSYAISLKNESGGALAEAVTLNIAILRGVTA